MRGGLQPCFKFIYPIRDDQCGAEPTEVELRSSQIPCREYFEPRNSKEIVIERPYRRS